MIKAAQGIKISAQNLENALAGTQLMVYHEGGDEDLEDLKVRGGVLALAFVFVVHILLTFESTGRSPSGSKISVEY